MKSIYQRDPFYSKWKTAFQVVQNVNTNGYGRTCIVTGSNSGIGYVTALSLVRTGYKVICCCRSLTKAETTCVRINKDIESTPELQLFPGNCLPGVLDLGDLESVRTFVRTIGEQRIDILCNNAGIMQLPTFQTSKQGYEMQFAVNFLAPWLLTELLKPNLRKAANMNGDGTATVEPRPSRVINVASSAHYAANFQLIPEMNQIGDPTLAEQAYDGGWNEYATSKMYQILHVKHLAKTNDNKIVAFALHPGVIATGLSRNAKCCSFTWFLYCWPKTLYCCCCCCTGVLRTDVDQGAASSVRACTDSELNEFSGSYIHEDCQLKEPQLPMNWDGEGFEARCRVLCEMMCEGGANGKSGGGANGAAVALVVGEKKSL